MPRTLPAASQRDAFARFLERLAAGGGARDEWDALVATHYLDDGLERARLRLVRASLAAGEWAWPAVPVALRRAARALHAELAR